jgi:hypothetical protein
VKTPNFFILGAVRSGTTSIYRYVSQHPDVFMSEPKEPFFFEAEYDRGLDYYWQRYFKGWRGQRRVGEARPANLFLPYVPPRIRDCVPHAKLVAIFRNPVDRAYSHWWLKRSDGHEHRTFETAVRENLTRIEAGCRFEGEEGAKQWRDNLNLGRGGSRFTVYVDLGYYAEQIARYVELFPRRQIKVLLFEDLCRDPVRVTRALWEFLGVDPQEGVPDDNTYSVSLSPSFKYLVWFARATGLRKLLSPRIRGRLRTAVSRWVRTPRMDPATREWLCEHYKPHNLELERLIERDLSHWLET